MKLKIKVKSEKLPDYNRIFTNSFHTSVDLLDYAEFYNCQRILKQVADLIFRNNVQFRKERNFAFSLDEYKTLRLIVTNAQKKVLPDVYHFVLINDLFSECERQVAIIRHEQEIFYGRFNSLLLR